MALWSPEIVPKLEPKRPLQILVLDNISQLFQS